MRMAAAAGRAYTPADIERVLDAWSQEQYPEVDHVFDRLDAHSIDSAVLSNTNALHWRRLGPSTSNTEYPIVRRARHHFASHLLGVAKPDPAIYAAVVERTGVLPERILFFDDSDANVAGARVAGWAAEQIEPSGNPAEEMLALLEQYGISPGGSG